MGLLRLAILAAVSSVLASCTFSKDHQKVSSEVSNLPPNESESSDLKLVTSWDAMIKEPSQNRKWWLQFYWAQMYLKDHDQLGTACKLLEGLSADKRFPLNSYSILLLKKNCPAKMGIEIDLSDKQKSVYIKWLKEFDLVQAQAENNQKQKLVLLLEMNADEKDRALKKETYLKLQGEARRLNDTSLQNLVLAELKKEFPQFQDDVAKNYYEISLDLIKDRSFDSALKRLNAIISSPSSRSELKYKSFKTVFRIYKSTQNKPDQWNLIERWGKWIQSQKKTTDFDNWLNEWAILKARWQWTNDQTNKAVSTLQSYLAKSKKDSLREEASYTLARIFDERKDYEKAKSLYKKSHDQSPIKNTSTIKSKNSLFEKNLWSLAWLEYKNGKYESARDELKEIVVKLDGDSDAKYLYWLAQCYLKLGKEDLFKDELLKLRKKEPLSFYTLLSYKDLKEPIPLLKKSSLSNKREFLIENLKNTLSEKEYLEIVWLISLDQSEVLQGWAKLLEKEVPDNYLPILLLYSQSGQFQNLLNSVQSLNSDQKNTITYSFPELLFPKPFFEDVQKNSQLRSVSMSFIYSIMRQESAFNPYARSPVDALGLLQLMPSLAKRLSVGEPVTLRDEFDLYDPKTNIFLGTKELKNLLTTHQNRYIPSIAGYNASSAVYKGWVQFRNRENALEFIEEIPYEETRTYIKLIIRNMIFYERIYFQTQPFEFPALLLEK